MFGSVPGGARVSFERKSIANQVESLIVGIVVVITTVVNGVILPLSSSLGGDSFRPIGSGSFFFPFCYFLEKVNENFQREL